MREMVEEKVKKIIFTSCPVTTELIVKTLEENNKSFSLYGRKGEYLIFDTFERAIILGAYDEPIGGEFAVYPVDGETVKSLCVRHRIRVTECRRLLERLKGSNGVLWFMGEGKEVIELTFDLFTSLLSQENC